MGRTMINITSNQHRSTRPAHRRGVSILEVIACTALVAVMIVPVAGVIRASGQAIALSDQDASTEAKMRRGLRWLSDAIRDGEVLGVGNTEMNLTLKSGLDVKFAIENGDLVMTDGSDSVRVAEGMRSIRFTELNQSLPPNDRIGIVMRMRANDPVSGNVVSIDATASIPTQE
jgi:hypothetical protein